VPIRYFSSNFNRQTLTNKDILEQFINTKFFNTKNTKKVKFYIENCVKNLC